MRERTHLEANWSNSEIVEIPASPGVEDQSAAATEKVDGGAQVSDPLLVAEEEKDIRSRLTVIAEQSKSIAELVLTERRRAAVGQKARETAKKAWEEMADQLATQQIAWDTERAALLAQLEESARGKQRAEQ